MPRLITPNEQELTRLRKRAQAHQDPATVLELSEKIFRLRPSLQGYRELHQFAQKEGRWPALRPRLLDFLKQPHFAYLLIQVYLHEGDIDAALEAVRKERGCGAGLKLTVAAAAEPTRPHEALAIYRRQAEDEIEQRGRDHYRTACRYLTKVRALYRQAGGGAGWDAYVAGLRQRHRTLRAFQDELGRAHL
jgi:uncharacterized Zn finger protein